MLTLPTETYIAEQCDVVDPQKIHAVRESMRAQLARDLHDDWAWAYETHKHNGHYRPDPVSSGRRALSGLAMTMLCLNARTTADPVWPGRTLQVVKDADNMTDRFNALSALVSSGHALANDALQRFYKLFSHDALVMDKWFALQSAAPDRAGHVLPVVRQLMLHPDFQFEKPQPRTQRDLQLLQCQPRRLSPQRCGRLCVLERARVRTRRHQPASGRPFGSRTRPLAQLGRTLPQCGARSHQTCRRQIRFKQRCA